MRYTRMRTRILIADSFDSASRSVPIDTVALAPFGHPSHERSILIGLRTDDDLRSQRLA